MPQGKPGGRQTAEEREFNRALAVRMAVARDLAGVRQETMARALGVNRTHISNIEAGKIRLSVYQAVRWAEVVRIPLNRLIERKP